MEIARVSFTTQDGVRVFGSHLGVTQPKAAALLLHMMPATRESWISFSQLLSARGVSSLAIDLRGHGDSVMMGDKPLDYHRFDDDQHRQSSLDVEAAAAWLLDAEKLSIERLVLGGASIGANLALQFASTHLQVSSVLALSPGLNYRGLVPEAWFPSYAASQRIYLAASEEDAYAYSSFQELSKLPTKATLTARSLKNAGHGTTMFASDPAFMNDAADWLCT